MMGFPSFMNIEDDSQGLLSQRQEKSWKALFCHRLFIISVVVLVIVAILLVIILSITLNRSGKGSSAPVNIIFFISDGFGPASVTMAREALSFSKSVRATNYSMEDYSYLLASDKFLVGTVRTYSSSSLVTDSAAGATAYACLLKTYNGAIAVDSNEKPCGTLLEAAKAKGMTTGLVVTSTITHATPASFSSHSVWRDFEEFIAKQQVDLGVDLMFGGGLRYYRNRSDGLNLVSYAKNLGYSVITTMKEFNGTLNLPLIGLFSEGHMEFEIDRDPLQQPSLADMTRKSLNLVQQNPNGFFLMVEGSRIDMAAHNNDPAAHYRDIVAFNEAFQVGLDFAQQNPTTLIISTSDHETGGLTLGRNQYNKTSPEYAWYPSVVLAVRKSAEWMAEMILSNNMSIEQTLQTYANITLNTFEYRKINDSIAKNQLVYAIGDVISYRALLGWTTWGHTGVDVNLYSAGFQSEKLRGNYNNVDIGGFIADILELDIVSITRQIRY